MLSPCFHSVDFVPGGSLWQSINREEPPNWPDEDGTKFYVSEIVLGLEELHNLNVIHGDLKADNIMLDANGHVVLIDFGLAKKTSDDETKGTVAVTCTVETIEYRAPEMHERKAYGISIDYWALGIMFYEFCTKGWPPFVKDVDNMVEADILHNVLHEPPIMKKKFKKNTVAWDLILKLLEKNPKDRIGI